MVQQAPRQLAAQGPRGLFQKHRPRLGQLWGEAPRRGIQIHPDAHHGVAHPPGLQVHVPLGEDAADLFPPAEHVVDPLDLGLHPGDLLNGQGRGHRRAGGQQQRRLGGKGRPQEKAHV